jgi:hypothetical protein
MKRNTRLSTQSHHQCRIVPIVGALALAWLLSQSWLSSHTTAQIQTAHAQPDGVTAPLARLSDEITVQAANRGNLWINLTDGRELVTSYVGVDRAVPALKHNQARGLSLASDDFDEDGTKDLVCGYAAPDGSGIVSLHRGNVDAIFPNSLAAQQRKQRGEFTDAPFLAPARVFELLGAAEFLGAGDFDADGHWDVVAASSSDEALYLLRGDGQLGLGEPERIELPGRVTAMVVGEINRADGLEDVVVGVNGLSGPQALVFERPRGAFSNAERRMMNDELKTNSSAVHY